MVFKNLSAVVLWMKVALALERVNVENKVLLLKSSVMCSAQVTHFQVQKSMTLKEILS